MLKQRDIHKLCGSHEMEGYGQEQVCNPFPFSAVEIIAGTLRGLQLAASEAQEKVHKVSFIKVVSDLPY